MRRILLVDDSRGVRRKLEACLEPWGFEIQHAENGAQALAVLRASPMDLVFLDIHMPVLDGPSLLRIMRTQGLDAPVVLITSGADTPVIAAMVKLGASEFVSKPFTAQQIREVVSRVLQVDLNAAPQHRPRVLLQVGDPVFGRELRRLSPASVEIDPAPALAAALELAERRAYALVLLDADQLESAQLFRSRQPAAGILGVVPGAGDVACLDAPDGALDGLLPLALEAEVARDFVHGQFLRPLLAAEQHVLRAAGFEGAPAYLPTYFRQLGRVLRARAEREASVAPDVCIDLRALPPDGPRIACLVREVGEHLEVLGAAPAFTVSPAQRALLAGQPGTERAVLLEEA